MLNPGEEWQPLEEKIGQWLTAGTPLVWMIDPVRMIAREYRAGGEVRAVGAQDALSGHDVLPGFTVPLHDVLLP